LKSPISIYFVDFWPGFQPDDNFLYKALKQKHSIILNEEKPDILFFSVFGKKHLKYLRSCRVFFSGENRPLNEESFDYSISWHLKTKNNHYHLPMFKVHIAERDYLRKRIYTSLDKSSLRDIWRSKTKFCCMVVSNPKCIVRNNFYKELSQFENIDSGGRLYNNIGGEVRDKETFIKDYKFVISFENSDASGYTTEKIIEPLMDYSFPVYWGNRLITSEINENKILHYDEKRNSISDIYAMMKKIEGDEDFALELLAEKPFLKNPDIFAIESDFILFLDKIVENHHKKKNLLKVIEPHFKFLAHHIQKHAGKGFKKFSRLR